MPASNSVAAAGDGHSQREKLRWGVLSTAEIAVKQVIPAMMRAPHCDIVALASRDPGRARSALDALGCHQARAYGSYQALLADPGVDAIYNPLPNHLHVPMTLAALAAGKHVLCEKPIALSAHEAAALIDPPPGLLVAEAFMVRFHSQWLRAREIVRSGELGELRAIRAVFCYDNVDPADIRNMAGIGGGGILDIGCYAVVGARFLFEAEPVRVVALVDRDPIFKTDRLASVIADFGGGRQLSFVCSTQLVGHQSIEALGNSGRVEIAIPFNPPPDQMTAILVDQGATFDGSLARREILPACNHYTAQAEAFALAVLRAEPFAFGVGDAIQNMRVIEAIFASERLGAWVDVDR